MLEAAEDEPFLQEGLQVASARRFVQAGILGDLDDAMLLQLAVESQVGEAVAAPSDQLFHHALLEAYANELVLGDQGPFHTASDPCLMAGTLPRPNCRGILPRGRRPYSGP